MCTQTRFARRKLTLGADSPEERRHRFEFCMMVLICVDDVESQNSFRFCLPQIGQAFGIIWACLRHHFIQMYEMHSCILIKHARCLLFNTWSLHLSPSFTIIHHSFLLLSLIMMHQPRGQRVDLHGICVCPIIPLTSLTASLLACLAPWPSHGPHSLALIAWPSVPVLFHSFDCFCLLVNRISGCIDLRSEIWMSESCNILQSQLCKWPCNWPCNWPRSSRGTAGCGFSSNVSAGPTGSSLGCR